MEMYHVPFWYVNYSWLMSHYNRCTCAHCRAVVVLTVYATIQQIMLLHKSKPYVYNGIGAVHRSTVRVCDIALIILGLWTSCRHRGRRIFMWASLTSWLVVISGTSLTLSMQRLTCYGGLLPTSNKLSNFLHLSWGSLVSFVWQAPLPTSGVSAQGGQSKLQRKAVIFLSDHRDDEEFVSSALPLSLFLPPPPLSHTLYLSFSLCQPVPLVQIFTFPVPVMLLSAWLCRINRRVSEDENAKCPPGARLVAVLTRSLLPPEGHSSHPSVLAESDIETASWTEVKDAPCVLP